MEFIRVNDKNNPWFNHIHTLYTQSFPILERRDMDTLLDKAKVDQVNIYAITKTNTFIGLTIFSKGDRFDIFDYLAIDPAHQHKGYGSTILKHVLTMYQNQPLFLEIEAPDPCASNADQRQKRYDFYIKNGFTDSHMLVNLYHVDYLILTNGVPISFDDYVHAYQTAYGKSFTQMLHPIYIGSTIKPED